MNDSSLSRRSFLKIGASAGALLASGIGKKAWAQGILRGNVLIQAGRDISPTTGIERRAIPSACWQCVARDAIIAYVEDGRLVKIEGNPNLPRTRGVLCAKGQAGMNQVYNPDRLLYPMKRAGKRGEGKWKRISWQEALDEVCSRLKELKDQGRPEEFMFHYGRMKASSSKMIKSYFLPAYGTKTIGNHKRGTLR